MNTYTPNMLIYICTSSFSHFNSISCCSPIASHLWSHTGITNSNYYEGHVTSLAPSIKHPASIMHNSCKHLLSIRLPPSRSHAQITLVYSLHYLITYLVVHNEIHDVKMACETLPSQVFQVVAKNNQRAKAGKCPFCFLVQTKKKTTKGTVPLAWRGA